MKFNIMQQFSYDLLSPLEYRATVKSYAPSGGVFRVSLSSAFRQCALENMTQASMKVGMGWINRSTHRYDLDYHSKYYSARNF